MYRPIAPANHNTVCKFGVGPRNEAHVVKFLPPSCPSRIFPELREAGPPTLNLENIATVLRTKALWHLHCYSLAVVCCGGASERRHWHRFCQFQRAGISKRGNQYLRRLLINGASANLLRSKATNADPSVIGLRRRRPPLVVAVALANKTARIAWAVMHRHENYQRVAAGRRPLSHVLELAREQ